MTKLNVDELDVSEMVTTMHFRIGAAYAVASSMVASKRLADGLWELVPFLKALGRLAEENPGRTRELWAKALDEVMPFGGEPLGMPSTED